MAATTKGAVQTEDYWLLAKSFERSLWARNLSPASIKTYSTGARLFGDFLEKQGMPMVLASISGEHVREFMNDLLNVQKARASSVETRHKALKQLFRWAVEEGELTEDPMARVRPPVVPQDPPAMLTDDQVRRILRGCEGREFLDRRDNAIFRLFFDCGMRRAELTNLKLVDVDLDHNVAVVTGKGRRQRACPFGRKTAQSLDRYLRVRAQHRYAASPALWLGQKGALSDSAVAVMIRSRAKRAGVEGAHAHLFRHGFAHAWLASGGQEQDLMMLAGWKSRTMLARYGASAAAARAVESHRRLSPGDRL